MSEQAEKRELHASFRPSRDYLIALAPLLAMAVYLYGWRVLLMAAASLLTALGCDLLTALFTGRKYDSSEISSYMFALIYTVMLPATASYHIVALGTAVAVLLGKQAFGGYGGYPFHPSAFGFAFTAVCFQDEVFKYPRPFSSINLGLSTGDTVLYDGISTTLRLGGVPEVDLTDLLIGSYAGPMGATFCLIIIACFVLLVMRRTISWQESFFFLLTCGVIAALLPRAQLGWLDSLAYEMCSGAVIFAAVFLVSTPSIVPKAPAAKAVYGIVMGLAVTLFRRIGYFEMGVCFAALLVNPLAPWLDRITQPKKTAKGGA
ncbi:MAG: RnfABCDGE type electron transport complex subunit D [Oscillospiraceae bacterium]|nr:RnfABCDGE type electron transport complex subunit D [Oscillospiraceae bacterium]